MGRTRIIHAVLLFFLLVPAMGFAARQPDAEELSRLIQKISERQSKDLKTFEKKSKAYFFEEQKPETISKVILQVPPGEAVTVFVLSKLSGKPTQEIIAMNKAGKSWPKIAQETGVKLKDLVKDVKDFRLGIG
ncbi:MAG TPA: hypothetical protein DEQ20_01165 [Desulfobulbaceae bacterium]|nr:MAG: hypothetical protein A2520_01230 [Deltaproteobacteria bacterium RIFOXYD12_FULL_53_23]HCC53527.1 hypothetical protein [Desulfobulbaceae bacterium]